MPKVYGGQTMKCTILMVIVGLLLLVIGIGFLEPELDLSRNQAVMLVFAFWTLWHLGITVLVWCAWGGWVAPMIGRNGEG